MAFNTQHTSAGVYFSINDRGANAVLAVGGVATLVMPLPLGIVGKNMRVLASEVDELLGPSVGRYWQNVELLKLLASQARYLNITRVGHNVKFAASMVTTFNNFATTRNLAAGLDNLDTVLFNDKDIMLVAARHAGDNGKNYYFAFEPDLTDPDGESFNFYVYRVGYKTPIHTYRGCTLFYKKDDNNEQKFIEEMVNNDHLCPIMVFVNEDHYKLKTDPRYLAVNAIGGGPRDPNAPNAPHGQLLHGSDGDEIDIYSDDEEVRNRSLALMLEGWENYRDWETVRVGIACDGGYAHPAIASKIAEISEDRMDCISNNSVPVQWQYHEDAIAYRYGRKLLDGMGLNMATAFATLSNNDIEYRASSVERNMWVPCSVAMTYAMLECDKDRSWLAPAGLNRGGFPWGLRLRHEAPLPVRDILNDNQINFPIHFKSPVAPNDAVGIYMWNADTLNGKRSPLDDIGVQRLLSVITESVRVSFLRYNFENDSTVLRKELKTDLDDNVLQPITNGRGLDWYESVVDRRNNTNASSANGDLYVDVFLDPTRYTKRIHLNLNVAPTGNLKAVVSLIERGQV